MIGIFGGTFDPIHYGHLRTALDVQEAAGLEAVHFIPLHQAVHREQPLATPRQRFAMLEAAISDQPGFIADSRELDRAGPSYMLDTLHSLRDDLGDTPLCLLLGGDAFNGFLGWREPVQVAALTHILVMERPGYQLPDDPALQALVAQRRSNLVSELAGKPGGLIHFLPVTQLDISASDIRQRIASNRSARYLTPDPVLELMKREGLYRNQADT